MSYCFVEAVNWNFKNHHWIETEIYLATFAKLRKAVISFVMSVRPSFRLFMEQLGSHLTDFHEIWYLSIFRKYVEKIQASLKL